LYAINFKLSAHLYFLLRLCSINFVYLFPLWSPMFFLLIFFLKKNSSLTSYMQWTLNYNIKNALQAVLLCRLIRFLISCLAI
jgi:hypothetical protein